MKSLRFATVKTLAELVRHLPDNLTVSDHCPGPNAPGPTLVVTIRGSEEDLKAFSLAHGITEPILD